MKKTSIHRVSGQAVATSDSGGGLSIGVAAGSRLLRRLGDGVGPDKLAQAERSLARLGERCLRRPLAASHVLLPYGGGKDSGWTLAYLRLMQLLERERTGRTFRLHVLFVVHPGITSGVYENVRNVLGALEIPGDPDVRVASSTLGGENVELRFGCLAEEVIELFRQDVLISGHLSQGNGRETFCNSCNFVMMNAVARYVIDRRGEVDFVVTGDSRDEVLSYWKWVQRTSALFGLERIGKDRASWSGMVSKLSEISDSYYGSLHGSASLDGSPYAFPDVERQGWHLPEYFGVFGDTRYEYWTHDRFLESLGFRLREDAFNFTESDCRNPLLMAHLRGLLADFEGRGYLAGVREYVVLVSHLMEKKCYSPQMIDLALAPYRDDEGILRRRREAEEHAWRQYRIAPAQLAAMVASPLTDGMARLEDYLRWAAPDRLGLLEPLRAFLRVVHEETCLCETARGAEVAQGTISEQEILARLRDRYPGPGDPAAAERFAAGAFGLTLRSLHLLLHRRSVSTGSSGACATELEIMRVGDPHQMKLEEQPGRANNLITGR